MFNAVHVPVTIARDPLAPSDSAQRLCLGYNSRVLAAWILDTLAKFRGA